MEIKIDEAKDTITIFGVVYSLELFRNFAEVGSVLEIVSNDDGVITITRHRWMEDGLRFVRAPAPPFG